MTTSFSPLKTVMNFTEYKYDNGHDGVYPLDTNEVGVLRKRCGTYHLTEASKLKHSGQGCDDQAEKERWKDDLAQLTSFDYQFKLAYHPDEPPRKRQKVDVQPPQDPPIFIDPFADAAAIPVKAKPEVAPVAVPVSHLKWD